MSEPVSTDEGTQRVQEWPGAKQVSSALVVQRFYVLMVKFCLTRLGSTQSTIKAIVVSG